MYYTYNTCIESKREGKVNIFLQRVMSKIIERKRKKLRKREKKSQRKDYKRERNEERTDRYQKYIKKLERQNLLRKREKEKKIFCYRDSI